MKEEKKNRKKKKTGRIYKLPDVRLTEEEQKEFEKMLKNFRHISKSNLVRDLIFGREVVAVYKDESKEKLLAAVLKLRDEIQRIGVNYNQMVKAINAQKDSLQLTKKQNSSIYLLGKTIEDCNKRLEKIALKLED